MIQYKAIVLWVAIAVTLSFELSDGFKYPKVRRDETVIDDYFGTKVR